MSFYPIFRESDNKWTEYQCRNIATWQKGLLKVSANFRAVWYIFGLAKVCASTSVVLKMDNNKNVSDVVLTKQRPPSCKTPKRSNVIRVMTSLLDRAEVKKTFPTGCFRWQIPNVFLLTMGTRQHNMFSVCAKLIRRGVVMWVGVRHRGSDRKTAVTSCDTVTHWYGFQVVLNEP